MIMTIPHAKTEFGFTPNRKHISESSHLYAGFEQNGSLMINRSIFMSSRL